EAMLGKIRDALRDVPREECPEDVAIDRSYRSVDPSPRAELVEHFIDRVAEYKAVVRKVSPAELPRAVSEACKARGVNRLGVPADWPIEWVPAGVTALREPGLTNDQLERSDGVLTACALGIAQTGTIVLDSGPGQGRRAITLLPDYHLCVIRDDQIVGLLPEAVARRARGEGAGQRPSPLFSPPTANPETQPIRPHD